MCIRDSLKGIDFLPDPHGHLGKTILPLLRVPQNGSDDVSHSGPSCTSRACSPCWSRSRSKEMCIRDRRWVQTGKVVWDSYTQIRGGLMQEDYVAFPYGRDVVSGAKTEEATVDALYSW